MPKVAAKKARRPAAKKRPVRRVARQKVGTLQAIGAKLDEGGAVLAAGLLQAGFLSLIAAALLAFLATVFSGKFTALPGRFAAMPEQAARTLGLNVMRVTVKGGETLSTRDIMQALRDERAGSIVGRPLMTLDPAALRQAIEELGPVESAAVAKLLPNTLHISIIERQPKALYRDKDGEFFVIDETGAIIRWTEPTEYTELLTISGTDKPGEAIPFLTKLRDHPVLFARTAGIVVVGDRRFDLRFRNGFVAKLPEDGVDQALRRLHSLEAGTGSLASTLDYIDLRDPEWAYYKPKDE